MLNRIAHVANEHGQVSLALVGTADDVSRGDPGQAVVGGAVWWNVMKGDVAVASQQTHDFGEKAQRTTKSIAKQLAFLIAHVVRTKID